MDNNIHNMDIFSSFPPHLRENVAELCINGKIGECNTTVCVENNFIKVTPFYSRRVSYNDSKIYCNHLLVKIPYAGRTLQWEIFFNEEDYSLAPDFDFNDEHFLMDPDIDVIAKNIPSLTKWKAENPKALTSVINEFVYFYKRLQFEHLKQDNIFSNIYDEYKLLIQEEESVSEDTIELYIENYTVVHFLISIKVDYSNLPPYLQSPAQYEKQILNPGKDTAILKVSYLEVDGSRVQSNLQLSPRLAQVLGENLLHIPPFSKDLGLHGYVSKISNLLKNKINNILNVHKLKNKFFTSLLARHGFGIVEYDSVQFQKGTVLCEVNGFYCLVTICIGKKFPDEKPNIQLQSVYHMKHLKPITDILSICRYSPRWKPEEMVERLFEDLLEAVPKFQKFCQTALNSK